ncbi:MAG: transmembrane anchor protein [Acidobacteriota bacterium]
MYNSDTPTRADLPTSQQLLRSTVIALIVAAVLLVAVVLPAEYGIDPTGVGRLLNLTEMGEIKQQLEAEAEADAQAASPAALPEIAGEPSPAAATGEGEAVADEQAGTPDGWREEFTLTLAPAAGTDLKLVMSPGDAVTYEWTVDQGHLNSDLHTDTGPEGGSHRYRFGRAETEVAGDFTAVSEGAHGWFWRNRSDVDVTVTLRVRGTYQGVQ